MKGLTCITILALTSVCSGIGELYGDGYVTPASKRQDATQLTDHGLHQVAPGVIGASMQHVKNQTFIDRGLVAQLNDKVSSNRAVSGLKAQGRKLKTKLIQLLSRRAKRDVDGEREFTRRRSNTAAKSGLKPNARITPTFHSEALQNKLTYYLLNITLGTPPQSFMVQVDTGSSDLWVPGRIIQFNGFDSKDSKSFQHLSDDFIIKYVKDSAQGYWAKDSFQFGGSDLTVSDLQFAVATAAPDATMGIMGIGPSGSEVSKVRYPNVPLRLAEAGIISRPVFSIYMGGIESSEGTILFGGSDKAKYRKLTTIPLVSDTMFSVELDLMALTSSKGPVADASGASHSHGHVYEHGYSADLEQTELSVQNEDVVILRRPLKVLLDTGTSLSYLPQDVLSSIATAFKASYESDVGMYVVHKEDLSSNPLQGINFQFGSQVIYMPKDELFWPLSWFSLEPSPYYAMTILASQSAMDYNILGDSFLRNAYVIYDLGQKQVHIGQYYPSQYSHIVSL